MPTCLRNVTLEFEYRTGSSNVVESFYIPCMRESLAYWRAVGYFTSQGLALAAKGLFAFVAGGGHMRLIASPLFEAEDIAAIERGYETKATLAERAILRQLPAPNVVAESQFLKDRLSCLAWLVTEGRLDIKVAVPTGDSAVNGIYHEKVGIFFDQNGDIVAFTGSANETVGGLATNFESIDVFVSWDDSHGRTLNKKRNFERLWSNSTQGLKVIDFSSAAKSKILSYRSKFKPESDPEGQSRLRRSNIYRNGRAEIGGTEQMDGSMLIALLPQHISAVETNMPPGPCLLVYQGFPTDFVLKIGEIFTPLNNPHLLYGERGLRLDSLNDICKSSIGKVVGNDHTVYVATYEELLRLGALINLSELVKYPIVIYRNNLFEEFPNQTDRQLSLVDQVVESGEPNPRPDELVDALYAFSRERFGRQLVQYQDLQNPGANVEYRDFFILAPAPDETFNHVDEAGVPKEAMAVSDTDEKYFRVKYGIFDKTWLERRTNFDLVIDETALKSVTLSAELMCLKSVYEANGLVMTVWVKRETRDYSYREDFKAILGKYWHSDSFRTLAFYESPNTTSKKYNIEQGVLIEAIVQQAEKAREGEQPRDIFVTSPTGSGKSLLFQIPAIYLAEKYGLVTVVVSPLKALMYDQVTALQKRGVHLAAYINSDVTLMDRNRTIERIKTGEVSMLYLSPELLLAHDLRQFIGERRSLGLLVVDEAHLVSTWGKDFRIDYWYLGTYIKRLRNAKYMGGQFPVLALTATAVHGGPDDVVFETAEALNMVSPKLFIGNVRRDEVKFDIRSFNPSGNHELAKLACTTKVVRDNICKGVKTIVYCPYVNHVDELWRMLESDHDHCGRYHGGIPDPYERQRVMDGFQTGQILVVLATKAFGMGIDVNDINQIYHHAPSGTLADYVQEIGRVARRQDVQGIATTDFHPKDLKFTKILWGLSKIKQYQAKFVLQKLNDLYTRYQKREMLLSVEDFGFIFGADVGSGELDNRVKSALLLTEKDLYLKAKQQYPVIMVRPKALYSVVYACVPKSIEMAFLKKYGGHCQLATKIEDNKRTEKRRVDCVVSDVGNVYELQLKDIWERHFSQYSFPEVKYRFFKRKLFNEYTDENNLYPRYRLHVTLNTNAGVTLDEMMRSFGDVGKILGALRAKTFDSQELIKELRTGGFKTEASARRVANLLVSLYSGGWEAADYGMKPGDGVLLTTAGSRDNGERLYKTAMLGFTKEADWIQKKFNDMFEGKQQMAFNKFISPAGDRQGYILRMAYLIEAFGLGSYELEGGKLSQIFIRINDPYKLRRAALDPRYSNALITEVEKRHQRSGVQMEKFFRAEMTDLERWNYIENYFLGLMGDLPEH